jgi:hypothetical protein
MARIALPWFWEVRNDWHVTKEGQRHFLGDHPDGRSPPRKTKGTWITQFAIVQAFHALMAPFPRSRLQTGPGGLTVVEVFDKVSRPVRPTSGTA